MPVVVDPDLSPLACSLDQVAALIPARTFAEAEGEAGKELGTFTEATHPTAKQVTEKITSAASIVGGRLGQEVNDPSLLLFARNVVALRTAMLIELGYFPEQANQDESAYKELKELFDEELPALIAALPDSSATRKGIYSLHTRSSIGAVLPTGEILP